MQQIPLQPVPSQQLQIVLGGQNCQLAIYTKNTGMFFDLNSNDVDISLATICHDAVLLNPVIYEGFVGNFVFLDLQGDNDPTYDGLGTRYVLCYLTADEAATASYQGTP